MKDKPARLVRIDVNAELYQRVRGLAERHPDKAIVPYRDEFGDHFRIRICRCCMTIRWYSPNSKRENVGEASCPIAPTATWTGTWTSLLVSRARSSRHTDSPCLPRKGRSSLLTRTPLQSACSSFTLRFTIEGTPSGSPPQSGQSRQAVLDGSHPKDGAHEIHH